MTELITKTPTWVFILFIALLAIGFKQSKNRETSRRGLLLFPCFMIVYSSFDLIFNIGVTVWGIFFWLIGFAIAWKVTHALLTPDITFCESDNKKLCVKGSWLPLIIILGIFSVKYTQGAISTLWPEKTTTVYFIVFFSFFNGLFMGLFSARAFSYSMLENKPKSDRGNDYSF